jgi:hypothetical protein
MVYVTRGSVHRRPFRRFRAETSQVMLQHNASGDPHVAGYADRGSNSVMLKHHLWPVDTPTGKDRAP